METTKQKLHDEGLFDSFPNADKVSKYFMFVPRRRLDLEEVKDDVVQ